MTSTIHSIRGRWPFSCRRHRGRWSIHGSTINVQPNSYAEALSIGNTAKSFTVRGVSGAGATFVDATGKAAVVDVAPVKKLARPVTLKEIKADPSFKTFPLVRISRLSVMPVTDAEWARIEKMAEQSGGAG